MWEDHLVRIEDIFSEDRVWSRTDGAPPRSLVELRARSPVLLPEDLYTFLAASNGGEGELGIEPGWFALWRAEDIVSLNREHAVSECYPGYFGFGSNGGGEMLAFEVTHGVCGRVAMVEFIGGEPVVIAESFAEFAQCIGTHPRRSA